MIRLRGGQVAKYINVREMSGSKLRLIIIQQCYIFRLLCWQVLINHPKINDEDVQMLVLSILDTVPIKPIYLNLNENIQTTLNAPFIIKNKQTIKTKLTLMKKQNNDQ